MTDAASLETSDIIPADAEKIEKQVALIQSVFKRFGFQAIKTSTIEFSENLEHALGDYLKQNCIEFFDPSGRRLMLRPDHTTPIARLAATRLKHHAHPLQLSYIDPVFRRDSKAWANDTELLQAGCEIIGDSKPEADASLILCCIDALEALGFSDFGIDIGHVAFSSGLDDAKREALLKGDYVSFGKIPKRCQDFSSAPSDLKAVYEPINSKGQADKLYLNEGLVHGIYYYTGLIFQVYVKGCSEILASGGRYDKLCSSFGVDQPAVGFALNLNAIRRAV